MSNSKDSSKRGWVDYFLAGAFIVAMISAVLILSNSKEEEKSSLDKIIRESGFTGCSSDCEPQAYDWEAVQAEERQQLAIANKKAVAERKAKEEQQRLIAIQLEKERKAEEKRVRELEEKKKARQKEKEKNKTMVASRGTSYQGSWSTTQATHYSLGNTGGDVPACGVINLQQTGTHYQGMRIVAANTSLYPCGSILEIKSKLGTEKAIVMDTGGFLKSKPRNIDILVRTEKEAYALGRYNVEFRVLRKGW